jgi:hypothetical protein
LLLPPKPQAAGASHLLGAGRFSIISRRIKAGMARDHRTVVIPLAEASIKRRTLNGREIDLIIRKSKSAGGLAWPYRG